MSTILCISSSPTRRPQVPTPSDPSACPHQPACPPADARDRTAARVVVRHDEQGWVRLCNAVILFSDGGVLLPDGASVGPGRPASGRVLAA